MYPAIFFSARRSLVFAPCCSIIFIAFLLSLPSMAVPSALI
jgi:hypothetical protein